MNIELFISSFEELFDEIEKGQLTPETEYKDLDDWDSLMALSLIAMVDEEYGIKLTGDDIRESKTISELFLGIKEKSFKK